ncbi:hypothetical protein GA0111570_102139 [Raineyella antarctica]|uniref:Uncharacterized protein n=2 Tax=Raineyella antarctica TaxID=1577474 RepID=A0A1G6GEE8_9ACTN|nr:hypothetical protein GA0111570_102139 [Raineyella antarctica]
MTGVIIAVVAVAWLAFGVPQFLSVPRVLEEDIPDPADRIGGAVRILRPSGKSSATLVNGGTGQVTTVPLIGADGAQFSTAELSTRLTRRTELARLRQIEQAAVRIRRRAIAGVLGIDVLVVVGALAGWWSWWWCTGAGALLVAGLVALRVSVVLVDREMDRRVTELRTGNQERTLAITRDDLFEGAPPAEVTGSEAARTSRDVVSFRRPLFEDVPSRHLAPSLWEPLPVPAETYVQRPIVARTVRTIDLSSPGLNAAMDQAQGDLPVTADGRDGELAGVGELDARAIERASRRPRLRAVGE